MGEIKLKGGEQGLEGAQGEGAQIAPIDITHDVSSPVRLSHNGAVIPPGLSPWQPGQSGNPNGRPRGARSKLGESFLSDLHDDWRLHGPEVLEAARREKPADYLKVIASILPRNVKVSVTDTMNEQELDARINLLQQRLSLHS
jgi:hypothetical protein